MGLFDWFKREKRSENGAEVSVNGDDVLLRSVIAGSRMDEQKAMSISAFAACVDFIADTAARLPVKLFRDCAEHCTAEELTGDRRLLLLNSDGGDLLTCYEARKAHIRDMLLYGSGFMFIERSAGAVSSLRYVRRNAVSVSTSCDPIFKDADISVNGRRYYPWDFVIVTRGSRNGVTGTGLLEQIPDLLVTAYDEMIYERTVARTGGSKKGFLQSERKLSKEAMAELKSGWREMYASNENNMVVLNDGVKFAPSGNSSVEMQLNEHKLTNSEMIAQCFGLSTSVVSGRSTAAEYMAAVRTAVLPVVESIQAALDRALLTESEKAQGLYFILDTSELLRGDMVSRFNAYSVALQNNIMSIDEVRYREDLPPLGFNYMKLGLADVLYDPKSGDIITPNMGTKIHTGDDENVLRDIIEERARHWTKGAHGYFTGSWSDGISGGSGVDKSVKNGIIEIEKSLSAAAKNYSVRLPESRNHAKLAENQAIHGKAFAGKGTKTEIKERFKLESLYQIPADEWKKMSGKGYVIVGGRKRYAELHWYESGNTIVDMKVKRYLDEG